MKRFRPREHFRRLRSGKKILINKGVKPKLKTSERKIFNHLSNPDNYRREFGGGFDFDKKGKLERTELIPGDTYSVDLPPDYEAAWHTHPSRYVDPPTPEDVMALLYNNKQQAEIIFRNGESFSIIKTNDSKALSKLPATKLKALIDGAYSSSRGKNFEDRYKKALEKLGFLVFINKNKKSPLHINITPVEDE